MSLGSYFYAPQTQTHTHIYILHTNIFICKLSCRCCWSFRAHNSLLFSVFMCNFLLCIWTSLRICCDDSVILIISWKISQLNNAILGIGKYVCVRFYDQMSPDLAIHSENFGFGRLPRFNWCFYFCFYGHCRHSKLMLNWRFLGLPTFLIYSSVYTHIRAALIFK